MARGCCASFVEPSPCHHDEHPCPLSMDACPPLGRAWLPSTSFSTVEWGRPCGDLLSDNLLPGIHDCASASPTSRFFGSWPPRCFVDTVDQGLAMIRDGSEGHQLRGLGRVRGREPPARVPRQPFPGLCKGLGRRHRPRTRPSHTTSDRSG